MPHAGSAPPPPWPQQPVAKQPRRGFLVPIGVALAVLLSAAALVVALMKGSGDTSSAPTSVRTATEAQGFDDDADRNLCFAVGPLMKESEDLRNGLINSGPQNSPERKAAIPKFQNDTYDWQHRIQQVLNDNHDPDRYLTRVLQRYVDDSVNYAEILATNRDSSKYEIPLYDLGVMDYSGVLGRCFDLDAPWWK
jgi:hypothetical protein